MKGGEVEKKSVLIPSKSLNILLIFCFEISYLIDKIYKIGGMDITFVTSAATDKEAKSLLTQLGLPFKKN